VVLDIGGAFAKLKNSVSGYSNGIVGSTAFNQGIGGGAQQECLVHALVGRVKKFDRANTTLRKNK
jgi:hypothetical protein